MKTYRIILAGMLAVAIVGCSQDDPDPINNGDPIRKDEPQTVPDTPYVKIQLSRGEAQVADAGQAFAWNLFDKVSVEHDGENLCLSPLSANIALTMLLNGAEGETLAELKNALGLNGLSVEEINENSMFLMSELLDRDNNCSLLAANSIWSLENYPINHEYKSTLSKYFNATAESTTAENFSRDVNAWCSKQTKGLIHDLVKPGERYNWSLLNALYFQNVWHKSVKFKNAGKKEFYNYDGSTRTVDYMQGKVLCQYSETDKTRHASISFGNGAYNMSISMPMEGTTLLECIEDLKGFKPTRNYGSTEMYITMPKFEFKTECTLNSVLNALGVKKAFDSKSAEFPNITSNYDEINRPYVNNVKQQCYIKVDEKGATAAAVTIVGGNTANLGPEPMVVDRPFIFTIYESSTQCILFMGKIEKF